MTLNAERPHVSWETVFDAATDCASSAMQRWTCGEVTLALDSVQEVALEELAAALQLPEDPSTLVIVGMLGELSGQLIMTFDDESAVRLVESLLRRTAPPMEVWGELERSALQETGNILGSAFLNSITSHLGARLWPSPPCVTRDYAMSVIQQAVLMQALLEDRVLVCRTRFLQSEQHVDWHMIFVPSQELLDQLRDSLATGTERRIAEQRGAHS